MGEREFCWLKSFDTKNAIKLAALIQSTVFLVSKRLRIWYFPKVNEYSQE